MSDKNEISAEEMKQAYGGAKYNLSAEKAAKHGEMGPTAQNAPPAGTGHLDPEVDLKAISGGVQSSLSAQNAGKRNQMSPTSQSEGEEGTEHLDPTLRP
jgi:hypothetical protein